MLVSCQEGWHRPALSLFAKVFDVFSCTLLKVACFQKFAFAKRSGAMKAPVGLLSNRTVLLSKMEGPRPDKFTLTRPRFCGNLSQQFNIYIFYLFAQYLRGWAAPLFDFSSRYITDWQDLPKKRRHDRSVLWRLFCCRFVRCTLKIAWPSAWNTRRWPLTGRAGKRRRKGAGNPCSFAASFSPGKI